MLECCRKTMLLWHIRKGTHIMVSKIHEADTQNLSLLRKDENGVAVLTLNRPEAGNSLSIELMASLQVELDAIKNDELVRCVIIAAKGHIFCAGHDLKELRSDSTSSAYEYLFNQCGKLMISIAKLPQPVIARVQGIASAAGCQLVATCDLAIADNMASFCTPGVHIGLFCSTPMVALSRNISRKAAMEMLLTGEPIDSKTAVEIGLINKAVDAELLDPSIRVLCESIIKKSPLTLSIGKEAFYKQLEMNIEEAYSYTSAVMTKNMMTDDAEEGIDAFLQKRAPMWKGT